MIFSNKETKEILVLHKKIYLGVTQLFYSLTLGEMVKAVLEFETQLKIQILNGLASNDVIESVKDLSSRLFF